MEKKDLIRDFGQLFILAFDGLELTFELIEFFKTFRIGGLILFSDNYTDPRQLKDLIHEIQDKCTVKGMPMLITTDHEGGKIQQFRQGFTEPGPMAEYGKGSPQETYEIHKVIARELKSAGVNLNFAPVGDLCSEDSEGSIGNRSFGNDPIKVVEHIKSAIKGLEEEGILSCIKHFPGHGSTSKSSHQELPVVDLTMEDLEIRDLVPFNVAMENGVSAVMPGHIVFPNAGDPDWPVSLSHFWLTDILRTRLNWEGPIITDALEMKALTNTWNSVECGEKALQAGADILLYYREKNQFQTFYELRMALEQGRFDLTEISKSMERVRLLKKRIRLSAG